MKKIIALTLSGLILTLGCDVHSHHHKKQTKQQVHAYKVYQSDSDPYIYWYIFYYQNNYYSCSSVSPLSDTDYSRQSWLSTSVSPIDTKTGTVIEMETESIPNQELGQQVEQTVDTTEAQIDAMVNEGNPNTGDNNTPSEPSSSDSGNSSGSDSGSGGGDSGGSGD